MAERFINMVLFQNKRLLSNSSCFAFQLLRRLRHFLPPQQLQLLEQFEHEHPLQPLPPDPPDPPPLLLCCSSFLSMVENNSLDFESAEFDTTNT